MGLDATARARERGHGGCRRRQLGIEVLLPVLAAGRRHPRSGSGHRADRRRRWQPRDGGDPDVCRRSARRRAICTGPNFTPPFPSYPSGHATFGGALFEVLRLFYGRDNITFTFISDEFNGVTRDREGQVRPEIPRTFTSLSQAEEENGQSRIYLGIHWSFDKTEGIAQGRRVARYVFRNALQPRRTLGRESRRAAAPTDASCRPDLRRATPRRSGRAQSHT